MKTTPIIFVRISDMEYYRGITETDVPYNGCSYVKETGEAHECFNFDAVESDGEKVCFGFVMQPTVEGHVLPQIHIEKIVGCKAMKKAEKAEGVTVVFCSSARGSKCTRVVGFYKNATVYRYHQLAYFSGENGETNYVQEYSFIAKSEDCVLLPRNERCTKANWFVPSSKRDGYDFGMGRSSIWYAEGYESNPKLQKYISDMIESTENYTGRNLMNEEVK